MRTNKKLSPLEQIQEHGLYQSIKMKLIGDYSTKVYTDYCPLSDVLIWNNRLGDVLDSKIPVKAVDFMDKEVFRAAVQKMNFYRKDYKGIIRGLLKRISAKRERLFVAYYNFDDNYFYFQYSYHPELIELFSNKSNRLSMVTEYMPLTFERRTPDLNLTLEIIDKVSALVTDNWDIHLLGIKDVENARHFFHREHRSPIVEVQSKMVDGLDLHPAQYQALRDYITFNGEALNGSEVGFGKCPITLSYAVLMKRPMIVICPKIMTFTWIREARKFFGNYFNSIIIKKHSWCDVEDHNLVITHFDAFREFADQIPPGRFDIICVDECTRIKNLNAKITRSFMRNRDKFKDRILLSGTFIPNRKKEAYVPMVFLKGTKYIEQDELNMLSIGAFWHRIKRDFYIRYSKVDLGIFIPEKITNITDVGPIGMTDRVMESIGDFTRFRVENAMLMAPHTAEFANNLLETSDATVFITSEFKESAAKIQSLIPDSVLHHGGMKDSKRDEIVQGFINGKFRTLVSTRASLAEGVNFIVANFILLNDLPLVAAWIEQIEGRLPRPGQKRTVFSHWMSASDSFMCKGLQSMIYEKYCTTKALTEGKQLTQAEIDQFHSPVSVWKLINENNARLGSNVRVKPVHSVLQGASGKGKNVSSNN